MRGGHTLTKTPMHIQYLSGYTLAGAVLQKEPHHLKVVLLGCHVQRSEAILHTAWSKTHITNMLKVDSEKSALKMTHNKMTSL